MSEPLRCRVCEADLPSDAPAGLCPKCLLQAGSLESVSELDRITHAGGDGDQVNAGGAATNPVARPVAPVWPELGSRIKYFGDYELLQEIARGGMGVVYKARQVRLNRVVALKMILAGPFASESEVQRFHAEAEAVAQLDHPQIVPIFEVGEHEGQRYFSMGFVEGESLAARLSDGPLTSSLAVEIMIAVSEAVQYAHEIGVIHRDLKPANILLDSQSRPRITDFGLARQLAEDSSITRTGQVLGTPSYMSPEQAEGQAEVGTATDIYALGAVLYAMLTGRPPFAADSAIDTLSQVVRDDPVPLRKLNPKIPRDLETICLKCLAKNPARRYPSAGHCADDLRRWQRHEPIQARPPRLIRRGAKWTRRHPAVALLIVATLLGLTAVGWQWSRTLQANRRYLNELDRHRIALAERECESSAQLRARQLLLETAPEHRGWEWRYAWQLSHVTPLRQLPVFPRMVQSLDISGDGQRFVTLEQPDRMIDTATSLSPSPGSLCVWERETLQRLRSATIAGSQVRWSPQDDLLAVVDQNQLKLIDQQSLALKLTVAASGEIQSIAFHPAEPIVYTQCLRVSGSDATQVIQAWDLTDGTQVFSVAAGVSYHPLAELVVNAVDQRLVVFICQMEGNKRTFVRQSMEARTGVIVREERLSDPQLAACVPRTMTADGQTTALISSYSPLGGNVKIFLQATRDEAVQWIGQASEQAVQAIAFDPSGTRIAFVEDSENFDLQDVELNKQLPLIGPLARLMTKSRRYVSNVYLYDVATGRPIRTYWGFPSFVRGLKFTPDGTQLFAWGGDVADPGRAGSGWRGDVVCWNATFDETARLVRLADNPLPSLAVNRDATCMIVAPEQSPPQLWNGAAGVRLGLSDVTPMDATKSVDAMNACCAAAPDADRLAYLAGGQVQWIDAQTGHLLESLDLSEEVGFDQPSSVTLSGNGQLLAYTSRAGVRVVDTRTRRRILSVPEPGGYDDPFSHPQHAALSRDGRLLAVTYQRDADGAVRVYRTSDGQMLWQYQTETVFAAFTTGWGLIYAAFDPSGERLAAVGNNGAGLVLDVRTGQKLLELKGHVGTIFCAAFSPCGSRIATGGIDQTVKLWNARTGAEVHTLRGHTSAVRSLAFSGDATRLISGGANGDLRIWDAPIESQDAEQPGAVARNSPDET